MQPIHSDTGKFLGVLDDAKGMIPKDEGNRDWRKFIAWYEQQSPKPFALDDVAPKVPVTDEEKLASVGGLAVALAIRLSSDWSRLLKDTQDRVQDVIDEHAAKGLEAL